jgi:LytS/YehU family sensor histidine kinase
VERADRARAEAELEALRAQLDPHFLFNSLNTLASLIDCDPPRARDYNERLARVYRYILASRGRALVLLSEELEFVEDYLSLLGVRFGDALRVSTEHVGVALDRKMVPPVALQVLLENVVKHNELSSSLPLEVRVVIENSRVSVSNPRRPRGDVTPSAHVGLRNLAERYRVVAQATIEVVDKADSFAVFLPLLPA